MRRRFGDILSEIQTHFGHRSDAEAARFFGVSPQLLSKWKKSDSPDWDLIFEKCQEMDMNLLILGKRSVLPESEDREQKIECMEAQENILSILVELSQEVQKSSEERKASIVNRMRKLHRASEILQRIIERNRREGSE